MPAGAPLPKVAATQGYGADIQFARHTVDECPGRGAEFAERTGAVLIHPFDHADIVAGQGTVGLEILEQCPDVKTIARAARRRRAGRRHRGCAVKANGRTYGSSACRPRTPPPIRLAGRRPAGHARRWAHDGRRHRRSRCPGDIPYAHRRDAVSTRCVTVSEESTVARAALAAGARQAARRACRRRGGGGAARAAARVRGPPVVAVLSGGNIDPLVLLDVIRHGLAAAGRFLLFRARIARPSRRSSCGC